MKSLIRIFFVSLFFLVATDQAYCQIHWETLVHASDQWKYLPGASDPGSTWRTTTHDDSGWSTGTGGFGFGDNDDATTLSPVISVFVRKKFNVVDVTAIEDMIFHIDYDDGFVAYLNGVEIARSNMGASQNITFNQPSAGLHEAVMFAGGVPEGFPISKSVLSTLLVNGENILAVEVHNESIGSSDLSCIPFLSARVNTAGVTYGPVPDWFDSDVFESSDLPVIMITTANGQSIPDEPKINATMRILNTPGARNYITDAAEFEGSISIETRGESSQMFPKKSYTIETIAANGDNENVALLGMPPENDWVLYAPYTDKTMMRDVLAYKMGRDLGQYAPRTRYVELLVNGVYNGVYVLIERIKVDKNRVDIASLNPDEISGDDLTGGYLLRIDKIDGNDYPAWTSVPDPRLSNEALVDLQYFDPKGQELVTTQQNYIRSFIKQFESAISTSSYTSTRTYKQFIDIPSFINFMIVSEIGKNVDSYKFSTYLYKDKDSNGGKLNMGPLWDFNLAFGNVDYWANSQTAPGWIFNDGQRVYWFRRLMNDPFFKNEFTCRWKELRADKFSDDYFKNAIDSIASHLNESQVRNYKRWPILGNYIWPNQYVGQNYSDEVSFLKQWIQNRLTWMDNNLPACSVVTDIDEEIQVDIDVSPNPSNTGFTISSSTPLVDAHLAIYDSQGRIVHTSALSIPFQWNGGNQVPSGIYYLRITKRGQTIAARKLIVIE